MNKHIFITGAGGYIGSRMVFTFLQKGYIVTALDRYFFGDVFEDIKKNKSLTIIKDDIRSFDQDLLKNVDIMINLASISNDPSSEINPKITKDINYKGAVRIARLAKNMGVSKYIFSSSCSVYGGGKDLFDEKSETFPISTYAKSKISAEKELLKLADENFSVIILRNSTVYGLSEKRMRFDLILNIMTLHAWQNNKVYIMGGGKQWRPLIHIDDCINAFLRIAEENNLKKINGQVFNVGSNEQNFKVYEVAEKIKEHFPNLIIENVPDDPDKRSYKVNFDKIQNTLEFRVQKNIGNGIEEIKNALTKGAIKDDIKTHTLQYYQYLFFDKNVLKSLLIRGKIL